MAGILDHIENSIYRNILGKDEFNIERFTMLNAWEYFIELCKKYPEEVQRCALGIKKKGSFYEISQVALSQRNEPLKKKGEFVVGRIIKADRLSKEVKRLWDEGDGRLMYFDKETFSKIEYGTTKN